MSSRQMCCEIVHLSRQRHRSAKTITTTNTHTETESNPSIIKPRHTDTDEATIHILDLRVCPVQTLIESAV